jgi:hypothetical protein
VPRAFCKLASAFSPGGLSTPATAAAAVADLHPCRPRDRAYVASWRQMHGAMGSNAGVSAAWSKGRRTWSSATELTTYFKIGARGIGVGVAAGAQTVKRLKSRLEIVLLQCGPAQQVAGEKEKGPDHDETRWRRGSPAFTTVAQHSPQAFGAVAKVYALSARQAAKVVHVHSQLPDGVIWRFVPGCEGGRVKDAGCH